jgi:hypothetical protein
MLLPMERRQRFAIGLLGTVLVQPVAQLAIRPGLVTLRW